MRIAHVSVGLLLALVAPLAAGWSKEDREIFRIKGEIAAHEPDPSATFYDILGVQRGASQEDINRAYRKKSRSLHPDKVKQQLKTDRARAQAKAGGGVAPTSSEIKAAVKRASERQARLSLIANILRGPSRDRYDHFLSHGFPLWKGTDYYYSRYRPGLGTVVFGLFLLGGGGLHYLILYMSWKRQKEFVERYVRFARETAWGSGFGSIPGIDAAMADGGDDDTPTPAQPMNRRQRRMQDKESRREDGSGRAKKRGRKATAASQDSPSSGPVPSGARKRVVAENGKILVVDSQGDVFLEGEDEEGNFNEFLLDPNELHQPTFQDTAVVRVPLWLLQVVVSRFRSKADADATDSDDAGDDSDVPQRTPSTDSAGDDFELLDKSTDSLTKVKASGTQQGSKPHKRRNKKR